MVRPVVFTPDIDTVNVLPIPVNSVETSSKTAFEE